MIEKNISNLELSRRMGLTRTGLSTILLAKNNTSLDKIDKLCKTLYTTPNYLFFGINGENRDVSLNKRKKLEESVYNKKHMGYRISAFMEDNNIDNMSASKKTGIKRGCFLGIKYGGASISPKRFFQICKGLKIEPNYLFYELEL